jgi:hypothetical protein
VKPRSGGLLFLRRITRSHGVTRSIFAPAFRDQPVEIRILDVVSVKDQEVPDSNMSELLSDVGATTTISDDCGTAIFENLVAPRTEEALANVSFAQWKFREKTIGDPTTTTSLISMGSEALGSQHAPQRLSLLRTNEPCGISGLTFQKSGTNLADSRSSIRLNRGRPR